jgi:hypothetical protein
MIKKIHFEIAEKLQKAETYKEMNRADLYNLILTDEMRVKELSEQNR